MYMDKGILKLIGEDPEKYEMFMQWWDKQSHKHSEVIPGFSISSVIKHFIPVRGSWPGPRPPFIDFTKNMKMEDWEAVLFYYYFCRLNGSDIGYADIENMTGRSKTTVKQKLHLASREIYKIKLKD